MDPPVHHVPNLLNPKNWAIRDKQTIARQFQNVDGSLPTSTDAASGPY
jgi:hypothetical protein